jgi:hypothetical protein
VPDVPVQKSRAERLAEFNAKMTAAGAPAAQEAAPSASPAPTSADAPATDVVPETPAAAAPTPPWWKVDKLRVLDEDKDVDLEKLAKENPAEFRALLGRGLSHETIKERLRSARDAAQEGMEREKRRVTELEQLLASGGYRIENEPGSGKKRIVGPPPQTAATGTGDSGQTDLEALERKAFESGTQQDWQVYARALRQSLTSRKGVDPADIDRIVAAKFEDGQRKLEQAQEAQRQQASFAARVNGTIGGLDAKFSKAGELKERYIEAARRQARDHVLNDPNATEESALKFFHDTADLVEKTFANAQAQLAGTAQPKPRPKAPTVLPSGGGAPAASPTDPRRADPSTPEGRKARIAFLEAEAKKRGLVAG